MFSHLDILYDYYTSSYFRMLKSEFEIPEIVTESGDIPKRDSRTAKRKRGKSVEKKSAREKARTAQKETTADYNDGPDVLLEDLSGDQLAVVTVLKKGDLYLDDIIEKTEIDSLNILAVLTELEIIGAVRLKEGRKYGLSEKN